MYKKEFENLLKTQTPRAVMFFGDDDYLIEKYINKILSSSKDAFVLRQYFGEYDYKMAKEHLLHMGLFGTQNTLLIKTDKKIDTKELKDLIEATKANQTSKFLLYYQAEDAKEKSRYFKDEACFVRVFKPLYQEAFIELKSISKLSDDVLAKVLMKNSLNLATSIKDLEKIELFPKDTPKEVLLSQISATQEANMDDLIGLLLAKKNIIPTIAKMLFDAESELVVLSSILNAFNELFAFFLCARTTGAINSKDFLGYRLPPMLEKQRGTFALKINQETYLKIFTLLLRAELELKEDVKLEKRAIFFSTILKLKELF